MNAKKKSKKSKVLLLCSPVFSKVSRSLLNSPPDQTHSKIPVKLIAATMPAALQWLHRKRFQSAPNIKNLWKVRSSKQMSMINCILYAPTNIIAATTAIFSSSTSSSLKPTNDFSWLVKPKFLMNYHIPDISLWVGRSKVRVPDWQALQVGRLGCLRCRLKKKSVKCCSFCISYWADSSQNRFKYLSFYPSPPDQYISDRDPWFHFKVLCVKFDLI